MPVSKKLFAWARRGRTELRDLIEYVLLPGLAAVLPWPVCFRVFRRMAGWSWLYGAQCREALEQAQRRGCCDEPQAWLVEHRLTLLLDHADHYLACSRTTAWMLRHMDVQGQWRGNEKAALLWTFHWGMGMSALRHARAHGLLPRMVLAAPSGPDFAGRKLFGMYVRARMRSVERILGAPIIFVPGGMREIRETLASGRQVIVVMDVPQDQVAVTSQVMLLGQPVSVPAVLPRLAVAQQLPVTVFYAGLNLGTGRRTLRIVPMEPGEDARALSARVFAHFDNLLRTAPAGWHLWGQALRFFVARDEE